MLDYQIYEGLGNTFVIIQEKDIKEYDYSLLAITLCKTLDLIDGLIIVKTKPLTMLYYNRDGSNGKMCGNGIRCFIRYCYENHLINQPTNEVLTLAGIYKTKIISFNPFLVKVNMGTPYFKNDLLKMKINSETFLNQKMTYQNITYYLSTLLIGVIHTVIIVDDLTKIDENLASYFCHLEIFEDRSNVDFVKVVNQNTLKVITYERGIGFTKACGTGACASFVITRINNLVDREVKVFFDKNYLTICQLDSDIYMSGPTQLVKKGKIIV